MQPQALSPIIMMIVMFAILYFVTIRPQRKQQQEHENMLSTLKVGDKVISIGGIVGQIVILKDDYITIETAGEKTRIELAKWAIRTKQ